MGKVIAADIGGTFIKYGTVSEDGQLSAQSKVKSGAFETADEFFDHLFRNMPECPDADCIGISAPGLIDKTGTARTYAADNLKCFFGYSLSEEMTKRSGLPAAAINDAKAAGLCELKLGNGRGTKSSAYLIIGTGAGGCICTENEVFGGADNFAGEFHFMAYPDERTGEVLKTGRQIGTMGLIKRYNEACDPEMRVDVAKTICDRSFAGEKLAKELVDDWLKRIAVQCLSLTVAINPELICIGGGISEEDWFINGIRQKYEEICDIHFQGIRFLSTRIDRCLFKNDANLLGAALYARDMIKN